MSRGAWVVRSNTTRERTKELVAVDPYCDAHLALVTRIEIDRASNVWRNCEEC